jgi:small subunit ribosomal protein S7
MPRRKKAGRRGTLPDLKYNDITVAKVINVIMKKGKKSVAESICYEAINIAGNKLKEDPVNVLKKAIENAKPVIEVKSRRVGGATYQVPVEVRAERRLSLAIRWLVQFAKRRSEKSMSERLAAEIVEAVNNRGSTIKKKEEVHRMAEANRSFAHYRW